jgi:chromosome segregation ATPase
MSRIDVARGRFLAALQKLEETAGEVGESLDAAARGAERLAQLEAERDRLLARVAELEDEMAALSSATEEVEDRLDGAIGEIRAALAR